MSFSGTNQHLNTLLMLASPDSCRRRSSSTTATTRESLSSHTSRLAVCPLRQFEAEQM